MKTKMIAKRDLGSIVCTAALILVGGVFYYDTTTMVDSDSFVFPRAIILMMVVMALIRLVIELATPHCPQRGTLGGNYLRSVLLVVTMVISVSLIPSLGFLAAIMIAFFSIMYLSMYEHWTRTRTWAYPAVAVLVVTSLYFLFEKVFVVQFPESSLF